MRRVVQTFVLAATLAFAATDVTMTVDQLVKFIQSSVKLKYPDKQVAEYLRHIKLTNKLDDRTIEELQGQGAGSKTVTALHELRDASNSLPAAPAPKPAPAPPPQAPPPDSVEQAKILDEVRDYALNYSKQLPNFLCLQVTRRYVDSDLNDEPGSESWQGVGTFTSRLSYFDQKEDYKLVMVNGRSVDGTMGMDRLGGAVSFGEFGSMLKEIFEPKTEARFGWDHWATLRGRRMYVFAYDIDQPHSQFHITWERSNDIVPAYRGRVYVDKETHLIMRVTQEPYDIPITFPVRAVLETLDYDFQKIGDNEFLVPLKAVVSSKTTHYLSKNEIEFRLYQKFGAEATIKFEDTPPPLPEDKTKEKP